MWGGLKKISIDSIGAYTMQRAVVAVDHVFLAVL